MRNPVNITPDSKASNAVQIWGFYEPITVNDVKHAVKNIAASLSGDGHKIHIMSGTHGYCKGQVGAVAKREEKFADEDRGLSNPMTKDHKEVTLQVHDFNTSGWADSETDHVTAGMSKLNSEMRNIVSKDPGKHTFILAYCCSAGTK